MTWLITALAYGLRTTEPTTWRRKLKPPPYGPGWRIYQPRRKP